MDSMDLTGAKDIVAKKKQKRNILGERAAADQAAIDRGVAERIGSGQERITKPAGRPPGRKEDRKTKLIQIYTTEKQHSKISAAAGKIPLATFVRDIVLKHLGI